MNKKTLLLFGFILIKFILQYVLINPYYDLHRDEYLHLDQANHLAWGYLSVPPVTSWFAAIIKFFGNSLFWVRFFPALFGALTIVVVWKAIEELKGNLFALLLGATGVLLSAFVRLNFLFQPNSFDALCWTMFCYLIIKYLNTEQAKWLFIAALVFAFGFLNKYNIVFLLIGFLPAIALTNQRKIFLKKELYLSVLLAALLISPNLFWQYQHHFPVFWHMHELAQTQLVNINRWDFVKDQAFYFIGALPVIIASLYALLLYAPFKKYRVFFFTFVFTLAVFTYLRAKSYYAIGLYPVYIAFGAVFWGDVLNTGWKKYLQAVVIAIPVLFYVLGFNLFYTIQNPDGVFKYKKEYQKYGLLRWEDGKNHQLPQDFADMLGWKELAQKVDAISSKLPDSEYTIILCDNYGQAGAINYYTKNKKVKAVSFNADYINWFDFDRKIVNFIRVKQLEESKDELAKTHPFFEIAYQAGSITNPLAREYKTAIFVFQKPKIDINQRLKAEINKEKSERYMQQ